MTATTGLSVGISELSSRSANGIDITLLWQHGDNTAVVVVADRRSSENLVLDVHQDDKRAGHLQPALYVRRASAYRSRSERRVGVVSGLALE
jgi:hypothetical protein